MAEFGPEVTLSRDDAFEAGECMLGLIQAGKLDNEEGKVDLSLAIAKLREAFETFEKSKAYDD
jgi:hypothetical protein